MSTYKNLAKMINQASKQMTPAQEFLFMFNQATIQIEKENARKPSPTFKPSSLGGCMRKVFFEVTGTELDENIQIDPNLVGMGQSGTARHEHIQQTVMRMKELGHDCEWIDVEEYLKLRPQKGTTVVERKGLEVKLYNEVLNMRFLCDGIIKFKGQYYVLEIKTETSFKWQGRTEPAIKHTYQAAAYASCLGINKVMYLYENRDMCSKKTFDIVVSEDDIEEKVIGYVETVNGYIDRGEVPPMTKFKSECNYCDYKQECKKW